MLGIHCKQDTKNLIVVPHLTELILNTCYDAADHPHQYGAEHTNGWEPEVGQSVELVHTFTVYMSNISMLTFNSIFGILDKTCTVLWKTIYVKINSFTDMQ